MPGQECPTASAVTAVNGSFAPLTFSVADGSLPPGLTINSSTGAIVGIPDPGLPPSLFSFTVMVTDVLLQTASRPFTIGVGTSLGITTTVVPAGTVGISYVVPLTQSGAASPVWSSPAASLPPGIMLSAAGVLSGTPATPGSYTFDVQLADSPPGDIDTKRFTIHVADPLTASIVPQASLQSHEGSAAGATVTTAGGRAPLALSVSGGSLPDGLYLQNVAPLAISGVPVVPGTFNFSLLVTDADGRTAAIPYTITVHRRPVIATSALTTATRNIAYNHALAVDGGLPPYNWLENGTLPPGLNLSSAGILSGSPTTNGSFTFTLSMNDSLGGGEDRSFTIDVADAMAMTSSVLPDGVVLEPYSTPVTATGGAPAKTFSISGGNLPPLVEIDATSGVISNLPLVAGLYDFTVRAVDSAGREAQSARHITVHAGLADLAVSKTDGVASVDAGGTTTYMVTLSNNGPSLANGATIRDAVAAGLTKTALGACSPAGGAVCPTAGGGAGQLSIAALEAGTVVVPTLPSGGSLSFTVTVDVTATSGTVTNTVTATPPAGTIRSKSSDGERRRHGESARRPGGDQDRRRDDRECGRHDDLHGDAVEQRAVAGQRGDDRRSGRGGVGEGRAGRVHGGRRRSLPDRGRRRRAVEHRRAGSRDGGGTDAPERRQSQLHRHGGCHRHVGHGDQHGHGDAPCRDDRSKSSDGERRRHGESACRPGGDQDGRPDDRERGRHDDLHGDAVEQRAVAGQRGDDRRCGGSGLDEDRAGRVHGGRRRGLPDRGRRRGAVEHRRTGSGDGESCQRSRAEAVSASPSRWMSPPRLAR